MRDGAILKHGLVLIFDPESNPLRRIPYLALFCESVGVWLAPVSQEPFDHPVSDCDIPSQHALCSPEAIGLISALHSCSLSLFLL
jgi:hypothetical protein